jgi:hypothetical protein
MVKFAEILPGKAIVVTLTQQFEDDQDRSITMSKSYKPPYSITPAIYNTVAEIGELVGRYIATTESSLTPILLWNLWYR